MERIEQYAKQVDLPAEHVNGQVATALVIEALRVGGAMWVKGGTAIELRLREQGRIGRRTQDLDVALTIGLDDSVDRVQENLLVPQQGFSFRAATTEYQNEFMRQFRVEVAYGGRQFKNVRLEVSQAPDIPESIELLSPFPLDRIGFQPLERVACWPLSEQVADKLHAGTLPPMDTNRRGRDLVDIYLLHSSLPPSTEVRLACQRRFQRAGTHQWPPTISVPGHWTLEIRRLLDELGENAVTIPHLQGTIQEYVNALESTNNVN